MTISNLLIYSLICSVGLLLMYFAIRFSRVGMTRYGRVAIIGSVLTVVLASAVPLLVGWQTRPVITVEAPVDMPVAMVDITDVSPSRIERPVWEINWWGVCGTIYIIGLVAAVCQLLVTITRILMLISRSERKDNVLLSYKEDIVPFTWGGYIIMSRKDYESYGEMLLTHESAHRVAHHWLDLLFMNLLGCLTWYCPAVRLIRRELQSTHEYTADRAVLAAGFDAKEYQMLLISKASGRRFANSVADCINNHSLKSRIIMMQKKSPMRHRLLRSLTLVPAAITVIALASSPVLASKVSSTMPAKVVVSEKKKTSSDKPNVYLDGKKVESLESINPDIVDSIAVIKSDGRNDIMVTSKNVVAEVPSGEGKVLYYVKPTGNPSKAMLYENDSTGEAKKISIVDVVDDPVGLTPRERNVNKDEKVFTAVEVAPKFKGGDMEMYKFLTRNMRYPEEAAKNDIQGRVTVQFVVKKDGSIGEVKVVRGVSPELDAEAIRVIKSMPAFEPGKMNGEPVNVWYTLPLSFKLSSNPVKTDSLTIGETK